MVREIIPIAGRKIQVNGNYYFIYPDMVVVDLVLMGLMV
jgi:hypothetical protein